MNERLQPERSEPQKTVLESVSVPMTHEAEAPEIVKSEKIGKYLYRTEPSGRITIYDESGTQELSLLKMSPEVRKEFFDILYTEALAALPPGTVVEPESLHSGNLSLSVFIPDPSTGEPAYLGDIELFSDPNNTLSITSIHANTKGVTRLMMARALQEFPYTKYISGTLHNKNYNAYVKGCYTARGTRIPGATDSTCFYGTPMYKYRSYVGFNRYQSPSNDEPRPDAYSFRSDPSGTIY